MKCVRCDDTGLIEYTSGTHRAEFYLRGELQIEEREATEAKPIYKRCSCRDEPAAPAPTSRTYE